MCSRFSSARRLLAVLVFGVPLSFEWPVLKGFNFVGGSRMIPEFVGADVVADDLHCGFHRRDRPRRHHVGDTLDKWKRALSLGLSPWFRCCG